MEGLAVCEANSEVDDGRDASHAKGPDGSCGVHDLSCRTAIQSSSLDYRLRRVTFNAQPGHFVARGRLGDCGPEISKLVQYRTASLIAWFLGTNGWPPPNERTRTVARNAR